MTRSRSRRGQRSRDDKHLIKPQIAAAQGWRCFYCPKSFGTIGEATFDHLVPLSGGGEDSPENLVLAHYDCNQLKGDRMPSKEETDLQAAFVAQRERPIERVEG